MIDMPSRKKYIGGYTLIELIAVICLIGLLMFVGIPRLVNLVETGDAKKLLRWIMVQVPVLKDNAVRYQKDFALNIDIDGQVLWISHEGMTKEEAEKAASKGYTLSKSLQVRDVVFAAGDRISSGRAIVSFYKKGYSDKVLIHISGDKERQYSLLIESFLHAAMLREAQVEFWE